MTRHLISEQTVRDAVREGKTTIALPAGTLVTPMAADLAGQKGIRFTREAAAAQESVQPAQPPGGGVVVFGSDHGGFELKGLLIEYVRSLGYPVADVGTASAEPCDYPDFAYAVGKSVADGNAWRGVMIDGAGIGSCVVANKIPGVRAACCHSEFVARNAREHNDTNVLTLGSRVLGTEVCKAIVKAWLETPFAGGRHQKRVDKIVDVERKFLK
jgi:ribose 5-phosphate isomerase B